MKMFVPIYSDGGPDFFIPTKIQIDYEYANGICLTMNDGWVTSYNLYVKPDEGYEHLRIRDFRKATFNDLNSQVYLSSTKWSEFIEIVVRENMDKRVLIRFVLGEI